VRARAVRLLRAVWASAVRPRFGVRAVPAPLLRTVRMRAVRAVRAHAVLTPAVLTPYC
jgi:hypothetical protein